MTSDAHKSKKGNTDDTQGPCTAYRKDSIHTQQSVLPEEKLWFSQLLLQPKLILLLALKFTVK